jgi:hypothetical protein
MVLSSNNNHLFFPRSEKSLLFFLNEHNTFKLPISEKNIYKKLHYLVIYLGVLSRDDQEIDNANTLRKEGMYSKIAKLSGYDDILKYS